MKSAPHEPAQAVRRSRGFTLVEVAVVIVIMAIVLGSIVVPLATQVEQRKLVDAQRQLEEIRETLIGYAIAQGPALPCPDKTVNSGAGTPNDGIEDVDGATGTCVTEEGNVPWATLSVIALDPWGHRIRYRVSQAVAKGYTFRTPHSAALIGLDSESALQICSATTSPYTTCDANAFITEAGAPLNKPAAVLISHGPNGWGAINPDTNAQLLPPGCANPVGCADMSASEIANADGNALLVSRPPSPSTSNAGQFDDVVVWLSPHVLKQRLVAAGRIP